MILYYLVLKAWLGLTGLLGLAPNEVVLRMPSGIAAVAAAVVVYLLGRRLFGPIAGLVAAGLYLANFLQMGVAQLARSSSLEVFLLVVSWYALFAALDGRGSTRRWWAVFVASSALAVYAALFSGLVLSSEAVALGLLLVLPGTWRERIRTSIRAAVVSFALVGVLIAPIALDAVLHGGPVWLAPVGPHVVTGFLLAIGGGSRPYELLVFGAAALGFFAAVGGAVRREISAYGPALAMASWFALPIMISFALTQPRLNLHMFSNRYLVVVVPPLCLLAGLGVSALRWRAAQAVLAAGLAVVAWPQLLNYYDVPHVQDIRSAAQWIEARYQSGDGLICFPAVECAIPIQYYLEADHGPAHFDPDSPGRFSWDGGSTVSLDQATVLDYAARHRRVFFVFARSVLPPDGQRLESSLGARFREVARVQARAAVDTTVVLYQVQP